MLQADHEGQRAAHTDKKLKPRIYRLRRKFNVRVEQVLQNWAEAPPNWKKPIPVPSEGMFNLEADHPIHQNFGPLDGFDDTSPRWQNDETFFVATSAMHILKGAQQELKVIAREARALRVWAHEEHEAILHALREAGV